MGKVGAGLVKRAKAVELSRRGTPEAAQLREDESHPMGALPTGCQLIEDGRESGACGVTNRSKLKGSASGISTLRSGRPGAWPPPESSDNMNTSHVGSLGLSDAEEDAIVSFMQTADRRVYAVNQ